MLLCLFLDPQGHSWDFGPVCDRGISQRLLTMSRGTRIYGLQVHFFSTPGQVHERGCR